MLCLDKNECNSKKHFAKLIKILQILEMFYIKNMFYCVIEILKQVNETNDLELEEKVEKVLR